MPYSSILVKDLLSPLIIGAIALSGGLFPPASPSFSVTSVGCYGNEERMLDCPMTNSADCPSGEVAAVICQGMRSSTSIPMKNHVLLQIRLCTLFDSNTFQPLRTGHVVCYKRPNKKHYFLSS